MSVNCGGGLMRQFLQPKIRCLPKKPPERNRRSKNFSSDAGEPTTNQRKSISQPQNQQRNTSQPQSRSSSQPNIQSKVNSQRQGNKSLQHQSPKRQSIALDGNEKEQELVTEDLNGKPERPVIVVVVVNKNEENDDLENDNDGRNASPRFSREGDKSNGRRLDREHDQEPNRDYRRAPENEYGYGPNREYGRDQGRVYERDPNREFGRDANRGPPNRGRDFDIARDPDRGRDRRYNGDPYRGYENQRSYDQDYDCNCVSEGSDQRNRNENIADTVTQADFKRLEELLSQCLKKKENQKAEPDTKRDSTGNTEDYKSEEKPINHMNSSTTEKTDRNKSRRGREDSGKEAEHKKPSESSVRSKKESSSSTVTSGSESQACLPNCKGIQSPSACLPDCKGIKQLSTCQPGCEGVQMTSTCQPDCYGVQLLTTQSVPPMTSQFPPPSTQQQQIYNEAISNTINAPTRHDPQQPLEGLQSDGARPTHPAYMQSSLAPNRGLTIPPSMINANEHCMHSGPYRGHPSHPYNYQCTIERPTRQLQAEYPRTSLQKQDMQLDFYPGSCPMRKFQDEPNETKSKHGKWCDCVKKPKVQARYNAKCGRIEVPLCVLEPVETSHDYIEINVPICMKKEKSPAYGSKKSKQMDANDTDESESEVCKCIPNLNAKKEKSIKSYKNKDFCTCDEENSKRKQKRKKMRKKPTKPVQVYCCCEKEPIRTSTLRNMNAPCPPRNCCYNTFARSRNC